MSMKLKTLMASIACLLAATVLMGAGASESKGASKAPVTLRIYTKDSGWCKPGVQDGEYGKYITGKLGIIQDITPAQLVPEYNTKIAAMAAAGDLPDIINTSDLNLQKTLVESGSLIPLDDLLKTDGKTILKDYTAQLAYARKYQSFGQGEKVFFVRWAGDGTGNPLKPSFGYHVRWDLYKQLGYPAFQSAKDLFPILGAMVKLQPTTPAGQKTYALGTNTDWGIAWTASVIAQFGILGGTNYANGDVILNWDSGDIRRGYWTDPDSAIYSVLRSFSDLNRKGLLDPDSFTQNWSQYEDKAKAGRYMVVFFDWYVPS